MQHRFLRSLAKTECDATLTLHVVGRVLPARCRSLGPNGFEAVANARLQVNQLVYVDFWLPRVSHPLNLCARVTHCDGFLYTFEPVADQRYGGLFAELLQEAFGGLAS